MNVGTLPPDAGTREQQFPTYSWRRLRPAKPAGFYMSSRFSLNQIHRISAPVETAVATARRRESLRKGGDDCKQI